MNLPKKFGHVAIVRKSSTQTNDADERLCRFDLAQRASHNSFNNSTALLVEQVDLVDDQKFDLL